MVAAVPRPLETSTNPHLFAATAPVVLLPLENVIRATGDACLRDHATLLDAQMTGDVEREAQAQARVDAWERWARENGRYSQTDGEPPLL